MKPHQNIELALQFASWLSPWWLLLCIPLVCLAAWWLYRNQFRVIARGHAMALVALRLLLLAALVFVAFRPSLIFRRVLTYPGRIALLLDDSESMTARDSALSDEEALRLSRAVSTEAPSQEAAFHRLAAFSSRISHLLRRFQTFSQGADRRRNEFWEEAGRRRAEIAQLFAEFDRLAGTTTAADDNGKTQLAHCRETMHELEAGLPAFFTGAQDPGPKAYDSFVEQITSVATRFLELQASVDRHLLDSGNSALRSAADKVRGRTRLELVGAELDKTRDALAAAVPGQFIQAVSLMTGNKQALKELAPGTLPAVPGRTDLVRRMEQLLQEESKFPLSAVVAVTDGRDWGGKAPEELIRTAAARQVPVFAAGVGSLREPFDLAAFRVIAPPFAVKGLPTRVTLPFKCALAAPTEVAVEVRRGAEVLAQQPVRAAGSEATASIEFTPSVTGFARYSVRLNSVPGEAFPERNNSADFALDVRNDRIRVLLADWKPRWETRFVLNTLQRLDYVELNPIIGLVQPDDHMRRGSQRGTWPENLDALLIYDLIVIGDLPTGDLQPEEWQAVLTAVKEKGKTVCFLGSGVRDAVPREGGFAAALLPVQPRATVPAKALPDLRGSGDLQLTPAGENHPLTRRLHGAVATGPDSRSPRRLPDSQVLLMEKDSGTPLITTRFIGRGKSVYIDTDSLWKLLNPEQLAGHTELYVALVTWALQGGVTAAGGAGNAPALALDQRAYFDAEPVQLWACGAPGTPSIAATVDGQQVAAVTARPPDAAGPLARALFSGLPPCDVSFKLAAAPEAVAGPVVVIEDYPELRILARDEAWLKTLAAGSGGVYVDFTSLEDCFQAIPAREFVERLERQWRLWGSGVVLMLTALILTVEWVWRKLVGLV